MGLRCTPRRVQRRPPTGQSRARATRLRKPRQRQHARRFLKCLVVFRPSAEQQRGYSCSWSQRLLRHQDFRKSEKTQGLHDNDDFRSVARARGRAGARAPEGKAPDEADRQACSHAGASTPIAPGEASGAAGTKTVASHARSRTCPRRPRATCDCRAQPAPPARPKEGGGRARGLGGLSSVAERL